MGKRLFAAGVTIAFFYVASPLILPISMGAVLAVLFFPWLEYLEKKRRVSIITASAFLTFGITIGVILPMSLIIFFAAKTAVHQLQIWGQVSSGPGAGRGFARLFLENPRVISVTDWITNHLPVNTHELGGAFEELATRLGSRLAELLGGMLTHLPGLVVSLAIVVISVYFFLVDGKKVVLFFRRNSIFDSRQTDQLLGSLSDICRSVILASLVSGGAQALLVILGCVFTGTPNAALIGLLVFIGSFLPVVGSAPITFGVAIQQLVLGRQWAGISLLMVAVLIFAVDNTVRPLFLKGSANLHPLLAFVAAFGGLQTLGFLGVFLGPIVAALFVVTLQIVVTPDVSRREG